jgi:5-(carboxyamino)imidazole ribonucleotide mutase
VQILATQDTALLEKVLHYRQSLKDMVMEKQARLEEVGYQQYLSGD